MALSWPGTRFLASLTSWRFRRLRRFSVSRVSSSSMGATACARTLAVSFESFDGSACRECTSTLVAMMVPSLERISPRCPRISWEPVNCVLAFDSSWESGNIITEVDLRTKLTMPIPTNAPTQSVRLAVRVRMMESGSSGTGARGPVPHVGRPGVVRPRSRKSGRRNFTVRGSAPQPERLY